MKLSVSDSKGQRVAGGVSPSHAALTVRRPFALYFFDPLTVVPDPPLTGDHRWEVSVIMTGDKTLEEAVNGANRTLLIGAGAALVLIMGLVLTVRAQRAAAELAELRSDFVSTVTHELKTPVATIRAAPKPVWGGSHAPTCCRTTGRSSSSKPSGSLASSKPARLRLHHRRADVYSFERLDLGELIEEVHGSFRRSCMSQSAN
jgi:hypothetical protein